MNRNVDFPTESLNYFSFDWLLLTQLWQVTLLAAVVWIVVGLFAKNRPHLAHALWLLVLIKCLTPPLLTSPVSLFGWLQPVYTMHTTAELVDQNNFHWKSTTQVQVDRISRHDSHGDPTSFEAPISENQTRGTTIEFPSNSIAPSVTGVCGSRVGFVKNGLRILLGVWLLGSVCWLIVTAIRAILFWRWTGRHPRLVDPVLENSLKQLSKKLGLNRKIGVRVVDCPVGPAVFGLFRPTILLPACLVDQKPPRNLEHLLAHELIHIRRGDLYWALIQALAGALFWFHPLICLGIRRVTWESERSCDEETITCLGCKPADYARSLIDILEIKQRLRVAPAVPGIRPVDITSARMERIMKLGQGSQRKTPIWIWAVMLVCGILVLPGGRIVEGQNSAAPDLGLLQGDNTQDQDQPTVLVEAVDHTVELQQVATRSQALSDEDLKVFHFKVLILQADQEAVDRLNLDWKTSFPDQSDQSMSAVESVGVVSELADIEFDPSTLIDRNLPTLLILDDLRPRPIDSNRLGIDPKLSRNQNCIFSPDPNEGSSQSLKYHGVMFEHNARHAMLDLADFDRIKDQLASSKILSRPEVMTLNEHEALISTGFGPPIVIGTKEIGCSETGKSTQMPRITQLFDRISLQLVPEISPCGKVQLVCQLVVAKPESQQIDGPDFKDENEDGQPVVIQNPILFMQVISATVDLTADQVLVLDTRQQVPFIRQESDSQLKVPSLVFIHYSMVER